VDQRGQAGELALDLVLSFGRAVVLQISAEMPGRLARQFQEEGGVGVADDTLGAVPECLAENELLVRRLRRFGVGVAILLHDPSRPGQAGERAGVADGETNADDPDAVKNGRGGRGVGAAGPARPSAGQLLDLISPGDREAMNTGQLPRSRLSVGAEIVRLKDAGSLELAEAALAVLVGLFALGVLRGVVPPQEHVGGHESDLAEFVKGTDIFG
jgi:hypothetical protein